MFFFTSIKLAVSLGKDAEFIKRISKISKIVDLDLIPCDDINLELENNFNDIFQPDNSITDHLII